MLSTEFSFWCLRVLAEGSFGPFAGQNWDLKKAMLRVEEARAAYGISLADSTLDLGLGLRPESGAPACRDT